LGQVVELNKRFLEGYLQLKDEPKIQDLRNKVLKYNRLLRDLGLRDHQVRLFQMPLGYLNLNANPGSTSYQSRVEDFRVVAVPDFASLGLVDSGSSGSHPQWTDIHFSVHHLPQKSQGCVSFFVGRRTVLNSIAEALAASTVKVAGRDVLGTWKVLISLGAAPLLYGLYAFIATAVMIRAGAPLKYRLWTPFIVVSALPFIGYAALKFGEAGMDVLKYVPQPGKVLNRADLLFPGLCGH